MQPVYFILVVVRPDIMKTNQRCFKVLLFFLWRQYFLHFFIWCEQMIVCSLQLSLSRFFNHLDIISIRHAFALTRMTDSLLSYLLMIYGIQGFKWFLIRRISLEYAWQGFRHIAVALAWRVRILIHSSIPWLFDMCLIKLLLWVHWLRGIGLCLHTVIEIRISWRSLLLLLFWHVLMHWNISYIIHSEWGCGVLGR